ncbi:MAG: recombinase family protein, partial [Ruminococcaceae bacterium]|nr:recombinase family protein [Oscillospiraceae bacterium]
VPAIISKELFDRVAARMEKNKRAPARTKATEEMYLLTTKLFCGKCGAIMAGESGTSKTMRKYHYYKCGNAKRKNGCDKKAIKKDWIENLVVEQVWRVLFDDKAMENLADMLIAHQSKENTDLPLLKQQLAETESAIENMLNAIQQGIFTKSTKNRLDELEDTKERLTVSILQNQIEQLHLTKEDILLWLHQFREMDIANMEQRQRLIDSFVNAVYVYDDRLILTFNYKDGSKTILLSDIESSNLASVTPPKKIVGICRQSFFVCFTLPEMKVDFYRNMWYK